MLQRDALFIGLRQWLLLGIVPTFGTALKAEQKLGLARLSRKRVRVVLGLEGQLLWASGEGSGQPRARLEPGVSRRMLGQ